MVHLPDPPKDDGPIVTCQTVEAVAAAGMNPVVGCSRRRCKGCEKEVWISPATLEIQRRVEAQIFCMECAFTRLTEANKPFLLAPPNQAQTAELYAASSGWAAELDAATLPPGSTFFWREIEWELATYFPLPCCGLKVALVRRVGSGLETWKGLGCPKCKTGKTYSVKQEIT